MSICVCHGLPSVAMFVLAYCQVLCYSLLGVAIIASHVILTTVLSE